jgi:primary-amine oxidase
VGDVIALVNLNTMKVESIEDYRVIPVPKEPGNYAPRFLKEMRVPPKPIVITQPEGVNWKRTGNLIEWQKWAFRVGWNPREGLVLHTISFAGRSVIHRASISEMVVPYGTSNYVHSRKNAFDMG